MPSICAPQRSIWCLDFWCWPFWLSRGGILTWFWSSFSSSLGCRTHFYLSLMAIILWQLSWFNNRCTWTLYIFLKSHSGGQLGLVGDAYNPALRSEAGWTGVDTRLWFTVRSSQADRSEVYLGSGSELASNHCAESVLSHAFGLSPESQRDTERTIKDQKRRKWWGLNQTLACVTFAIFHYTDRLDRKSFELPSEFSTSPELIKCLLDEVDLKLKFWEKEIQTLLQY